MVVLKVFWLFFSGFLEALDRLLDVFGVFLVSWKFCFC